MQIIEAFINFIVGASFEVGSLIDDFLSFGKKQETQNPVSAIKRIILSLIGGFIICSIVLLIVALIIWLAFKFLF